MADYIEFGHDQNGDQHHNITPSHLTRQKMLNIDSTQPIMMMRMPTNSRSKITPVQQVKLVQPVTDYRMSGFYSPPNQLSSFHSKNNEPKRNIHSQELSINDKDISQSEPIDDENENTSTQLSRIVQTICDFIFITAIGGLIAAIYFHVEPAQRHFYCTTDDIYMPYIEESVKMWQIAIAVFVIPMSLIFFVEIINAEVCCKRESDIMTKKSKVNQIFIYLSHLFLSF
jgi:magnesium-transporting ATPase (P-type)